MNALLPEDVAVRSCAAAPRGWSARFDATSRAYCYRVLARPARSALERGRALHWPHALDFELLSECAAALQGTHDFTAFTPTETDHVRFRRDVLTAYWRQLSELHVPAGGAANNVREGGTELVGRGDQPVRSGIVADREVRHEVDLPADRAARRLSVAVARGLV